MEAETPEYRRTDGVGRGQRGVRAGEALVSVRVAQGNSWAPKIGRTWE